MNKLITLAFVLALVIPSLAIVRDEASWKKVQKASAEEVLEFRVALTQRNTDILDAKLMDVSDPYSANYGKHWTIDQILDLVAPEPKVAMNIIKYLKKAGAFNIINKRDSITAHASVQDLEKMFSVEFFNYQHTRFTSTITRASTKYILPVEMQGKVDIIAGIYELPFRKANTHKRPAGLFKASMRAVQADPGVVVPETLYNLYNIPTGFDNNPQTSICLAEFQDDQSFNQNDLKVFATKTGITPFTVNSSHIVGPYSPAQPDLESTLDVQYGGAVAQNATVWFWTVAGWMYEFASDFFATEEVPYIVSMSWGWTESAQCESGVATCNGESDIQYVTRVNNEFAKIGLRGVSLLAASGDQGAPGDGNPNCDDKKAPISPIYPGASPYITAVGATMLAKPTTSGTQPNAPICSEVSQKCATSTSEIVCSAPPALITTGGGFSDYAPMPSYQQSAVQAYLKSGVKLPTGFFNASNRGFPDVAALGHNYIIIASKQNQIVDGTSCSSPVFGGVVALLNSIRLNNGKSTLGFLNPMLYAAAAADSTTFNDITSGNNYCTESCCAKYGYLATKGWDATTGLGTPNFKSLAAYVSTLN